MVVALPFRALRYASHRVAIENAIAPARSRLPDDERQKLLNKDPRNIAHVVYGEQPDQSLQRKASNSQNIDKLHLLKGASLFADWQRAQILQNDNEPCFYLFRQTFSLDEHPDNDEKIARCGIFACLDLDKDTITQILPHEQIIKERSLHIEAQRKQFQVQIEPVFLTYPDEKRRVHRAVRSYFEEEPDLTFEFDDVFSEMWILDDESTCARIQAHLEDCPLYIADGHHRVASFARELEHQKSAGIENPKVQATAFLVADSDPGLLVRATHRLFHFTTPLQNDALITALTPHFKVEKLQTPITDARQLQEKLTEKTSEKSCATVLVIENEMHLLCLKEMPKDILQEHEQQEHYLDTALVDRLLLRILKELDPSAHLCFDRDLEHVLKESTLGQNKCIAALVRPPSLATIYAISDEKKTLCPKSSAFMPRLPIGICMAKNNTLKEDAHDPT